MKASCVALFNGLYAGGHNAKALLNVATGNKRDFAVGCIGCKKLIYIYPMHKCPEIIGMRHATQGTMRNEPIAKYKKEILYYLCQIDFYAALEVNKDDYPHI